MNDDQLVRYGGSSPSGAQLSPEPVTIDVRGGPGFKRDHAGLLEYWQMARRHKGAVILATCLGAVVGFALTLSSPRVYQAHTSLEIQGLNEEFLNMKSVTPVSDAGSSDVDTDIQTQVKILQSRVLLTRVSDKLQTRPRPTDLQPPDRLGMWRRALKVNPPSADQLWSQALGTATGGVRVRASGATRIVDVSCDSTSAQLAADFCNTMTQEYIDQNLEARWKSTEYTGQWLTKQLQDLKIKLEKQEEDLQAYARDTNLVFTGEKSGVDGQETKLDDIQKELSAAQADRIGKQSKYEMARSSPAEALPDVLDDVSLKTAQASLADLTAKLAQLKVTFTPNATEVKRLQAQIDTIEVSLEASRANILVRIRKEYEGAERREALLTGAYNAQAHLLSGQAEETAHYNLLKRDVEATRLLYETLLQRLKEASIATALRANNIRVVDAADRPGAPYKPDVSQQVTLGLLFGVVAGIAFAVVRERADRTLQDPGDVTYYTGVPELGVVPIGELLASARGPVRAKSTGLMAGAPNDPFHDRVETISWRQKTSLLAESYRTTLTSVLFSRRAAGAERPRVLVLTSASPKEGKTTTVCNLGIALVEINQRVLLIDADLRRPRLHGVFNVENDRGLSQLLLSKTPVTAAMLEPLCASTTIPGLYVLPSGSARRNASSLLHSARLPEVIALARELFDTVVIDTPPMVNIADARVVAKLSDALILVVRSGATTRDAAQLALTRFAEDGTPLLGAILNFWNPSTPGYAYYKYYYAGYYHYYGTGGGKGPDNGNGESAGGGEARTAGDRSEVWRPSFSLRPHLGEGRATRESES